MHPRRRVKPMSRLLYHGIVHSIVLGYLIVSYYPQLELCSKRGVMFKMQIYSHNFSISK